MRARLMIPVALMAIPLSTLIGTGRASAGDLDGQNTSASAQASGGQLTVHAGVTRWSPPTRSKWATEVQLDPPGAKTNSNQPYGCTYSAGGLSATATLGVGGPQPGQWVFPVCSGPGDVDPMPAVWVTGAKTVTSVAAQVNPKVVAEEAVKRLGLGSPTIEMAPPSRSPQLVNVSTWLWVAPGAWLPRTASASAGKVTTTATATPTKVVWDMGGGHTVTCDGPGTAYNPSDPNASTDCSYTWDQAGSYKVTATVYWSVTWTARGAAGGGNLGVRAGRPAEVGVTVTESEAINTPPGGSD